MRRYSKNETKSMPMVIIDVLKHAPIHCLQFGPAYVKAGGSAFDYHNKAEISWCRQRLVDAGVIELGWDEDGYVIYRLTDKPIEMYDDHGYRTFRLKNQATS